MKSAIDLLFEAVKHSHEVQEDYAWYAWVSEEAEELLSNEKYGPWITYNKELEESHNAKQNKEETALIERSKELLELDNLSPKEISELLK